MKNQIFKDVANEVEAKAVAVRFCKDDLLSNYTIYSKVIKDVYSEVHDYLYTLHEAGIKFTARQATKIKFDLDYINDTYAYVCQLEEAVKEGKF